jgi:tetratricopeptide repeat protein 30
MVEMIFKQSAEFCSEHDTWKLNVAHVFFMQVLFHAITFLLTHVYHKLAYSLYTIFHDLIDLFCCY